MACRIRRKRKRRFSCKEKKKEKEKREKKTVHNLKQEEEKRYDSPGEKSSK
jgi:hypothetical protein